MDSRLETLQTDSKMGIASLSRTAGEVYTDLLELGSAFVPALSPAGDGAAILTEQGYAVLKGDTLAGFLEEEAAKGLELLAGRPSADVLEAELAGNQVSAKVTSACTKSRLEFRGDAPSLLRLSCKAEARLSEDGRPLSGGELEQLQKNLELQERARLEAALEQLRAMGTDCAGLGIKAAMAHPARWQAVQADWPEWFSRMPVEVTVQIKINS